MENRGFGSFGKNISKASEATREENKMQKDNEDQIDNNKKITNLMELIRISLNNFYYNCEMQASEQTELVSYVNLACTPFSIAGAFYMIYSYFQSWTKSFSSKLVFCLALSDLLLSIVDVMEILNPNDENCTVLGFLRVTGIYSNML
jgi:hypothetical protein